MKKRVQLAILLLFILLSCTDNADMTERVTGTVGFGTADVASSRAGILTDLKPDGFCVNAYATGAIAWETAKANATPEFMHNQEVTWTGSAWTYTPVKYWPGLVDGTQYGKVSFFAWSNVGTAVEVPQNTTPGAPQLTYTVPNAQSAQHDLVTAAKPDKIATGGAVTFEFKHVLSRIGFTARLDRQYPGVTVTITSLKVKYANNAVESKGFYTFGETVPWSFPPTGKVYMSHTGDEVMGADVSLDNPPLQPVPLNSAGNDLMLLPQPVAAGAVMIDVAWTVNDGTTQTYNQTVNLPAQTWEPGYRYDYDLKVSLVKITNVQVNAWGENERYKPCTITYNANGGTGQDIVEHRVTGVEYPLAGNTFTPPAADQIFGGWDVAADDNRWPGEMLVCDGDKTLRARWIPLHISAKGANCYMVKPGEAVEFPVVQAYYHNGSAYTGQLHVERLVNTTVADYTGKFGAEVVWDDANVIRPVALEVTDSGKDAMVIVETHSNSGNALVKIYKAGDSSKTPVWSYHIWVTSYTGAETASTNNFTFMDRNLGATRPDLSLASRGFHYEWGRKDPFPGEKSGTAGYDNGAYEAFYLGSQYNLSDLPADAAGLAAGIKRTIENPTTYYVGLSSSDNNWLPASEPALWNATGNKKSIYDPCPEGWRVPPHKGNSPSNENSPWRNFSGKPIGSGDTAGGDWGANAKYPAAGERSSVDGFHYNGGVNGRYWTATPGTNSQGAADIQINNENFAAISYGVRARGMSVRCVKE